MENQLTSTNSALLAPQNDVRQLEDSVKFALARAEAEERIFALEQRRMKPYAESDLVPVQYRGRIGNCMIAAEMAKRIGANTLSVMQNLYIVHGNPAWSAKFAIAIFNTCGRFSAIKYRFDGAGDEYGCTAYATERATGEIVESPKITWKLVKAEGWLNKAGSKWKTMPDLMFRYRSAAYLVATTAPELLNGLRTVEEYEDAAPVGAGTAQNAAAAAAPSPSRGLAARLAEAEALESASVESESVPAVEDPVRIEHKGEDLKDAVRAAIEKDREDALRKSKERAMVEQELIVE